VSAAVNEAKRAALGELARLDEDELVRACVQSFDRASLDLRGHLPSEAERARIRRWVRRALSHALFIGLVVQGEAYVAHIMGNGDLRFGVGHLELPYGQPPEQAS
jgi:hypothetical protein